MKVHARYPTCLIASALLAAFAEVELASSSGVRRVPVEEFYTGPKSHVGRPDELITAIRIPRQPATAAGSFVKLSSLAENDWPCASAAASTVSNSCARPMLPE